MNNIPDSMEFTSIFHGMLGRDFITAFNENFNIADRTFISMIADMIYKVKSTDIKEFRIHDGAVQYTLDNENLAEREWKSIDITAWGNIKGNIYDQADLKTALDSKAAAIAVESLTSLVNTLNMNVGNLTNSVETANKSINENANSIADVIKDLDERIYSTTVKELRLNEDILEWSPDGINWYRQEIMSTISWGNLTGDITQQSDLYQYLSKLDEDITELNNALDSHVALLNETKELADVISPKVDTNTANIETINNSLDEISTSIENLTNDKADSESVINHINNHENPHGVTKAHLDLDRVDNTSDLEKPVSTPQQNYINEVINSAVSGVGNAIVNKKNIYGMALVSADEYNSGGAELLANTLVFVTDKVDFDIKIASAELSGVGSTYTSEENELEIANEVEES